VSEIFTLVPKKNSKTTGGAALAIIALLANRRPRAEMLLVGPTQDVADLAFQQASGMIAADEEGYLQKRFHVREHVKEIKDRRTGAALKITQPSRPVRFPSISSGDRDPRARN
jgi:phage terminase large subunit-like protein